MGAGKAGNFGNTYGSSLDAVSNFLAMASFVPGTDTVTNFLSIPVDLARGDFLSAGLDVLGMIPVLGEVADLAKVANKVDNIADTAKAVKKTTNFADFNKKIHIGRQGKHIVGHNNYMKGKSILNISTEKAQDLINKYSGKGQQLNSASERVDFKTIIGKYVDQTSGKAYDTTVGTIRYSKTGTHIVPAKPNDWRK